MKDLENPCEKCECCKKGCQWWCEDYEYYIKQREKQEEEDFMYLRGERA